MTANAEQIARACVGALLALRDLAELGYEADGLIEFSDLTIRAAMKELDLVNSDSQAEQLKDENVMLIANSGLLKK